MPDETAQQKQEMTIGVHLCLKTFVTIQVFQSLKM